MNSPSTNEAFENFFSRIYGHRWSAIRAALAAPPKQVIRKNLFGASDHATSYQGFGGLRHCFWKPEGHVPLKNGAGLYQEYIMDPASILVALSLEASAVDSVLDMCAAPGGKTLVLAEQIGLAGDPTGHLISNEFSKERRDRLVRVLHEYIPKNDRMFISVKGLDANQYGLRWPGTFDRVLADVPCSGERHLLANSAEYLAWSEKRTKNLAVRQFSILSSAWLSVKTGGRIVYSTCSISPVENDGVVAKLLKKREVKIVRPEWLGEFEFLECSEYGYQVLPDTCGFGPMYFSVIDRV